MPNNIQLIQGLISTLDHLEDRIKAYRSVLAAAFDKQLKSSDLEDAVVSDEEIETIEGLIAQSTKRIIDSDPYESGFESFQSFISRQNAQDEVLPAEHVRRALQWIKKTRTFIAYLRGIVSSESEPRLAGEPDASSPAEAPLALAKPYPSSKFGQYVGDLHLKPLVDGRRMELLKPFGFLDARNKRWPVPAGTVVDGASIPQALWTIGGGPWEGEYRDASVVHDYYCSVRLEPWRDVHRLFYEAMRASGVSLSRAKLMYAAVYFAGPRHWVIRKEQRNSHHVSSK